MKKTNILIPLLVFVGVTSNAQVKDISLTLAPKAEYVFWNDQAGFNDGTLVGGKVGFGFGEYIELSGVYTQSLDLTTNFEDYGLTNFDTDLFTEQDVELTRWGGEFKANIGTKKLKPFITLGTGIQEIKIDGQDNIEQIYTSFGAGVEFKLTDRIVFNLQAKNVGYNFNASEFLLTDSDKVTFNTVGSNFESERLSNWSVLGSLEFYLGGRKPGKLTELDKAYLDNFKRGFKGLQLVVEPSANFIAFDSDSLYNDAWFLGGYVGLDFNEYIGVRGFYFQGTNSEKLTTDFDNSIAMYGMEFRANLNDGKGVTPYLILGGGYMNVSNSYENESGTIPESSEFATGGLGLIIPLSKNIELTGSVRGLVTSGLDAGDLSGPDDIQTHIVYNTGLKFVFGKKQVKAQDVYKANLVSELEKQQASNDTKIQNLKTVYETKVIELEEELKLAYEANDIDKAIEILEEKKEIDADFKKVTIVIENAELEQAPKESDTKENTDEEPMVKMTPVEFESLINRILQDVNEPEVPIENTGTINNNNNTIEINALNKRIDLLEKLLLEVNTRTKTDIQSSNFEKNDIQEDQISEQILKELERLNRKIDQNTEANLNLKKNEKKTIIVSSNDDTIITSLDNNGEVIENKKIGKKDAFLQYQNTSALLGFNFGDASTANFGFRFHYNIKKSPLQFMPEIYIGFGEDISYGASGNIVYGFSIKKDKKVTPYIGLGLGFANIDDNVHGNYNVILGAQIPFLHKNVYVDYTMRNEFKYNQISIGYKLPF